MEFKTCYPKIISRAVKKTRGVFCANVNNLEQFILTDLPNLRTYVFSKKNRHLLVLTIRIFNNLIYISPKLNYSEIEFDEMITNDYNKIINIINEVNSFSHEYKSYSEDNEPCKYNTDNTSYSHHSIDEHKLRMIVLDNQIKVNKGTQKFNK